ncbi:hypothetical protein CSB20_10015 [bacterium DOLZORAL124_64_63]|nr:MAG: hypothetical protein CSB20_10015 [bacterium DOLZORAL124_64_63]
MGKARKTEHTNLPHVWPTWLTTLCGMVILVLLTILLQHHLRIKTSPLHAYLTPLLLGGGAGFLVGFLNQRQKKIFQQHLLAHDAILSELELRERRFRLLAENAQDVIFRYLLEEERYDYVSPAVLEITGRPSHEFYDNPDILREIILPEDRFTLHRLALQIQRGFLESPVSYRIRHRDGHVVWLNQRNTLVRDDSGRPVSLEGLVTDITDQHMAHLEKQELEMRLLHSQRLEAMGQLVSGIAHDFNNLLTVINGYSEILLNDIAPEEDLYLELTEIRRAGSTAKELTQQLLNFSGKSESQAQILHPEQAVAETLRMLKRLMGEDIHLHTEVDGQLPSVQIAQVRFDQILMNLLLNARDAMPRGGNIHIRLSDHHADGQICSHCQNSLEGRFLKMRVSDDGVGMSPEVSEKIFNPFFSTKDTGHGRGLGLATVNSIATNHQGHIQVESATSSGTTFTILLPAYLARPNAPHKRQAPDLNRLRGTETLLVVEDEEQVRLLSAKILQEYGYTVHMAANAEEGRRCFRELADSIDLVLTDVVMPGDSGVKMVMGLLARKPELPVIFMSGYLKDKAAVASIDKLGRPLLRKPFNTPQLLQVIRRTLDGQTPDD